MNDATQHQAGRHWRHVRLAAWAAAALVLLLPWVAMRFTAEVNWDPADFILAGALILAVGIAFELALRRSIDAAYRAGAGIALFTALALVWTNAAVGVIGAEGGAVNLMFDGVVAVAIAGAVVARFRAAGMASALLVTAGAHATAALVALGASQLALETVAVNAAFVALWLTSAWLISIAARRAPRTAS